MWNALKVSSTYTRMASLALILVLVLLLYKVYTIKPEHVKTTRLNSECLLTINKNLF